MNHNVHFTFEPITDSWGAHSDENINSGAILSFDADCKVTDSQTTSVLIIVCYQVCYGMQLKFSLHHGLQHAVTDKGKHLDI